MNFWYVKKRTGKVNTNSFYLPEAVLKKLDFIAELENQSRSVIVEVALRFEKGGTNAEFARVKRKFYKREKKAKAISCAKKHFKIDTKAEKAVQKSLFDECDLSSVEAV